MKLPPGWESFWEPAIPFLRRERLAYRKTGMDLIVEPGGGCWRVLREGVVVRKFPSLPEAIEWADKQPVEAT